MHKWKRGIICFLCAVVVGWGQQRNSTTDRLAEKALQEYRGNQYAAAAKDFQLVAERDPANALAAFYWGQSLFRQEKYGEAIGPFEDARERERRTKALSSDQHRILTDQLAMAYGITGQLGKSRALLDDAIKLDPQYPLNYYNLACVFAEASDKPEMLASLDLAFQRKTNMLKGEQIPDPRTDSSFQKYVRDPEFLSLMKKLGLQ